MRRTLLKLLNHAGALLVRRLRRWRFWCEGVTVGTGTVAYAYPILNAPEGLRIGRHCTLNYGVAINARGGVTIGDHVRLSQYCILETAGIDLRRFGPHRAAGSDDHVARPIVLGNYVWVATGAIVLGGVTVGDGSIIAAGAVVTRDVPPGHLARGVPARCTPLPAEQP